MNYYFDKTANSITVESIGSLVSRMTFQIQRFVLRNGKLYLFNFSELDPKIIPKDAQLRKEVIQIAQSISFDS